MTTDVFGRTPEELELTSSIYEATERVERMAAGVRDFRRECSKPLADDWPEPPDGVLELLARECDEAEDLVRDAEDMSELMNDTAEELRQAIAAGRREARPILRADEGDLSKLTPACWRALRRANDPPTLFRRGDLPVRLEQGDDSGPILKPLTKDRVRHELARVATWKVRRSRKRELVDVRPPLDAVADVLATPDPPLPRLERIVEVPVFASDGSLVDEPGYHGGLYYEPSVYVPHVPTSPSAEQVVAAHELLMTELLGDFPFTGDAERAHALALLLGPFVRDLIDGPTPLHLIEAPRQGSGKTLLADVITRITAGRPLAAMTEGRDEDEWRKRITAKLLPGPGYVAIDNLRHRLDSAAVSAAITATTWEDRVLGVSETAVVSVRCTWIATGNNPGLSDEIARRTVRIRIDPQHERPWLRSGFRHPDLRAWVHEHRGPVVAAALTLCRAWLAAGRPEPSTPSLGMFEAWSRVIGGVIEHAGVPGFLGNLEDFYRDSDADAEAWRAFLALWFECHGEQDVTAGDLIELADGLLDIGHGSERSRLTRLGTVLAQARDRRYGHLRIEQRGIVRGLRQWGVTDVGT